MSQLFRSLLWNCDGVWGGHRDCDCVGTYRAVFNFSDTWQLIINTGTTIITFLMVFLIQNTLNRDSAAIQLKLDEIIRSTHGAHNSLLDLEEFSTNDLEKMRALYQQLAERARSDKTGGIAPTGTPGITAS